MIENPKTCYVRCNGRLAQYHTGGADRGSWEAIWNRITNEEYRHALRPTRRLGTIGPFLKRWLPRDGTILEAGCGTGIWVQRLRQNGWDCVGVDFAASTIRRTRELLPHLPVCPGDITKLQYDDSVFSGYVSLGVVEHFIDGPQQVLKECCRVLRPGGIALISVPYDGPIRQRVRILPEPKARELGLTFYQYYFTLKGFEDDLEAVGLTPLHAFCGYGVARGLSEVCWPIRSIVRLLGRATALLDRVPVLPRVAAHMMLFVARRQGE